MLLWAILLLALGLTLAVMEIFFTSAGILGVLAAASLLGAMVLGFQHSTAAGLAIVGVTILGVPGVIVAALTYWPRTRIGKQVMLGVPRGEEVLPDDPQRQFLKGLVGRVGVAKCKMLPGGMVEIAGQTIDATSEGVPIEQGATVRVIQVRGMRLVVRPTEGEAPTEQSEDILRRPIDSLAPDPFDDRTA